MPGWIGNGQSDASGGGSAGTGMAGAPFSPADTTWRARRCSHPVHRRPRQSRADEAPGVQVVRTVARSTWTPGTTPAPQCVGRRRTGWELGRVVVHEVLSPQLALLRLGSKVWNLKQREVEDLTRFTVTVGSLNWLPVFR